MVPSIPILMFHSLDEGDSPISFPPAVFRRGVARLQAAGYRVVSLTELAYCLKGGMPFPDKALVITFDDGYRTVFDEAFPVLRQHGMTATVFLTVGQPQEGEDRRRRYDRRRATRLPRLAGREMLSWREIGEMHRAGMDFGAHTLSHPDLRRLPEAMIEREIGVSKSVIEDALGRGVTSFAYPGGYYDERSLDIVRQRFACACSDKLALASRRSDRHALERVDAYFVRTDRLFATLLAPWFGWYVRMRSIPRALRRGVMSWMKQ